MAAGVMTNFLIPAPAPAYFPPIFECPPSKKDGEVTLNKPEGRVKEEGREVDEDVEEEDEESEAQEEEEEALEEVFLDVTKQLLRFADLISRDVQRYFGRCSGDQDACDIYSDSVSVTTSGRLRYYDDLLKIARAGSPVEQDSSRGDDHGVRHAEGNGGLGPLAELFEQKGPSQSCGRPMIKRHLPLSFWNEPIPGCSPTGVTHTNNEARLEESTRTDCHTHVHYNMLQHHNTHTLESNQPDFSDLLAYWDHNPEITQTLTEGAQLPH